jgi:hypothetical protein
MKPTHEQLGIILKHIDRFPATIASVAWRLKISEEAATALLQSLIDDGYICAMNLSAWQRLWSLIKKYKTPLRKESFLTLTAKGFLKLRMRDKYDRRE